ncbi:hypothetical protein, partial [Salmonella enterica]
TYRNWTCSDSKNGVVFYQLKVRVMMKISEINYSVIFDALKAYYEVEEDDSVWEIFNQADDQIEEIANALKVLGE